MYRSILPGEYFKITFTTINKKGKILKSGVGIYFPTFDSAEKFAEDNKIIIKHSDFKIVKVIVES